MTERPPRTSYNEHALLVLEFDRIRDIVASLAESEEGYLRLTALVPSNDAVTTRALLAETDELIRAMRFDDPLPETAVHNISDIFTRLRIKGISLSIENLAAVADNLQIGRTIREYFVSKTDSYSIIWNFVEGITPHQDIENRIRKAINPDLTIDDNASPELRSIRRSLERAKNSLRDIVDKTLAGLADDVVSERLVTVRNGRLVIPVRESMKRRVQGAIHDRSQTGKTLFIEPLVSIEANNKVSELEMAERAEIERILVQLTASIAQACDDIELNHELIVRFDTTKAKARYAFRVDGEVPKISDDPVLNIVNGRHPILDWKFRKAAGVKQTVVPLDIKLGEIYNTMIVTGPNAGGKTVALKTAGLLTAMALSGMPIPADKNTSIFVPTGFYADIGDEQSIEDDLSTFSSHMRQIVTILREARSGALVLLDELGGGTNPSDGEAIALAVLKKLTGIGACTIATTHHGGLKVYAHEAEGVVNASMEFDNKNLRPTFALRTGIPGSSYAFEIAGRMGMPKDVLEEAERLAGGERKSLESLIAELDQFVRQADVDRNAAKKEREELELSRKTYDYKILALSEKKDDLMRDAVEESRKLVEDVNSRIETAIKNIREQKASHDAIVEAKSLIKDTVDEIKKKSKRTARKPKKTEKKTLSNISEGMRVWVSSLESDAVIEEVLDGGKKARIRPGKSRVSLVVKASVLFEGSAVQKQRDTPKVSVKVNSASVDSLEIDLRGMTFDLACDELDNALDHLFMTGSETAQIIHGSGVLKRKVLEYLQKNVYIDSWRTGKWNEGSSGVTVVKIRK